MSTLVEFVLARIAEDKAAAEACARVYPPPWDLCDRGWVAYVKADEPHFPEVVRLEGSGAVRGGWLGDPLQHFVHWDPARVIADCDAKQHLVEATQRFDIDPEFAAFGAESVYEQLILTALAVRWADHPNYDESWRP